MKLCYDFKSTSSAILSTHETVHYTHRCTVHSGHTLKKDKADGQEKTLLCPKSMMYF